MSVYPLSTYIISHRYPHLNRFHEWWPIQYPRSLFQSISFTHYPNVHIINWSNIINHLPHIHTTYNYLKHKKSLQIHYPQPYQPYHYTTLDHYHSPLVYTPVIQHPSPTNNKYLSQIQW